MGYIAIKDVRHAKVGIIKKGSPWTGDEREGARLARMGVLRAAEVEVPKADPPEAAVESGSGPSSASQAAPVSLQTTSSGSASGDSPAPKKGGRPRKNPERSSSSTTGT